MRREFQFLTYGDQGTCYQVWFSVYFFLVVHSTGRMFLIDHFILCSSCRSHCTVPTQKYRPRRMLLVKCAMEASFGGSTDDSAGNFDDSDLNLASLQFPEVTHELHGC